MLSVSVFGPVEEFETKTRRDAHRFFFVSIGLVSVESSIMNYEILLYMENC